VGYLDAGADAQVLAGFPHRNGTVLRLAGDGEDWVAGYVGADGRPRPPLPHWL
jgi:hypothetical protein